MTSRFCCSELKGLIFQISSKRSTTPLEMRAIFTSQRTSRRKIPPPNTGSELHCAASRRVTLLTSYRFSPHPAVFGTGGACEGLAGIHMFGFHANKCRLLAADSFLAKQKSWIILPPLHLLYNVPE